MDTSLAEGLDESERTVYNCFINTGIDKTSINSCNRLFSPMDMYPTILASMGYEIPGDRLGLGTNLFSNKKTLAEEYGIDYLNEETSKYSKYYIDNFS